jgi:cytochrome c-type biogenesis protein CcmH/NrfG
MALSKSVINVAFGCVVALLVLTAAIFAYRNFSQPGIHEHPALEPSVNQLPENHPTVDFSNMRAELEQRISKDPKNPDYVATLGNLYYDNGEYDKAADCYKKSLDLRPQNANVETDLATCYFNLGQSDKALETLNRVLKYSPGFSQALYNKGVVLIHGREHIKDGIAVWETLLKSDPEFSERAGLEQKLNQIKAQTR